MEEPSSQDSREDLFYTTTSDIFEFTPYEIVQDGVGSSFIQKLANTLVLYSRQVGYFSGTAVVTTSYVAFDFTKFIFSYLWYIRVKFGNLIDFLEGNKDKIVRTLMWRRGLLFRPATHGGVIALAAVAIVAGGLFSKDSVASQDLTLVESALTVANTPETIIPEDRPRSEVISYQVKKGNTLSQLAEEFAVSADSILWVNGMVDTDTIKTGDKIKIPPVTGVVHKVAKGQTIYSVAKKYKANPQTIANFPFNYIDDSLALSVGQTLYVPGGVKPKPVVVPVPGNSVPYQGPVNYAAAGSGLFARPVSGSVNQSPSWWHPGIDIGAKYGSSVYAAGSGRVIRATRQAYGFGWHIFVDHGNGYVTAYAHLSGINVNVGQNVNKGQMIGAVGCTGLCTGSHLHFEVRRNGSAINPLSVL